MNKGMIYLKKDLDNETRLIFGGRRDSFDAAHAVVWKFWKRGSQADTAEVYPGFNCFFSRAVSISVILSSKAI